MDRRKRNIQHLIGGALAVGALFWGGCSTTNWPIQSKQMISQGERAVSEAKASNASLNAPVELKAAEEKLSLAKEEFAKGWHNKAARLAEEAAVDAELAQAKSTTEKNKRTAEDMRKNIDALRQEIEQESK
jgi:hypothetical protein